MSTQPGTDLNLEQLLRSAAAAARDGKRGAAHALFLALSREHADDARVWLGVAGTADDPAEQRAALERAVTLDPANERARRALERLRPAEPRTTAVLPETLTGAASQAAPAPPPEPELAPEPELTPQDEQEPQRSPFPLLNMLAALVILLLLVAVGVVIGRNLLGGAQVGAAPTATLAPAAPPAGETAPPLTAPTPSLAAPTAPATVAQPTALATTGASATPGAVTAAPATTATTALDTAQPTPPPAQPTPPPALGTPPTAGAELPLGQVLDYDGWSVTLLRPDYALSLDGAIGDLQPTGRFVLAVVAISNNAPTPRTIPPDFFTLTDAAGQSYRPVPGASTAYLALYERGQRGDLALEDLVDPGSGMRSVPILFDVPAAASGLRLTMPGAAGAGWPVGGAAPQPVGP